MARSRWHWLIYPAVALGLPIVTGSAVAPLFVRAYNMPSRSMLPNLLVGDHFLARTGYYADHAPERGEIALFLHGDTTFVKRVIGLPGDTIQMRAGRLWINGSEVPRAADSSETDGLGVVFQRYRETLPGGVSYPVLELGDNGPLDDTDPIPVPADSYLVMGDNRDNSNDSRVPEFGLVPRDKFTDRPILIYFSYTMSRIGSGLN